MTIATTDKEEKRCLECGQALGAGRRDRKFCNDICRTAFNNQRRAEGKPEAISEEDIDPEQRSANRDMAAIEKVQSILLHNRIRLYNMSNLYEDKLWLTEFYGFGVNLKYYTSEYKHENDGRTYRMCYDYGYHIDGDIVYLLYRGAEIHFN